MIELWKFLIEILSTLWPFREVQGFQRGVYVLFNRPWREVGPGIWPVVPYLMDVIPVSVVPAVIGTPLQSVTLRTGTQITFSVSATVRVTDPTRAHFSIDDYTETSRELLAALVAEELSEAAPDRFTSTRKFRNLLEGIAGRVSEELEGFGILCSAVRFTTYVENPRTFRLLMTDGPIAGAW
jgi:regulator of protease activity HflC (stomatin/prohibitin superfamily)